MPHDVFISHSNIDKAAADAACAIFEASGIRCWIAPRDVAAGSEWAEAIIDAIEGARVMVLIFSSHANDSRQVRREIELAVNRGLTIMPLRLEGIEPTRSMAYYMAGVHWIDALSPPLEAHLKRLVDWIRPHLREQPAEAQPKAGKTEAKPKARPDQQATRPDTSASTATPPAARAKSFGRTMFDIFFGAGSGEAPKPQSSPAETGLPNVPGLRPEQDTLSGLFNVALDFGRQEKREEAIAAYRRLIAAFGKDDRPIFREQVVRAFFNIGNMLSQLGRDQEAIASFEEALKRARDRDEEGIRETVARILFNKAHSLDRLGRKPQAIAEYDRVIQLYGDDVDGMGRELAGRAVFTKAILLAALGREDDAILAYDQFLSRYGADEAQQVNVAEAMFNIAAAHGVKGRNGQAVAAYDLMLGRFGTASDPAISEFVAKALYNKGNRLSDMKKPAEAISSYEDVIARFGTDPRMPDRIAKAMLNKANQLGVLGKKKDANAAYEAVIAAFGGSSNAEARAQADNARRFKS